MGCRRQAGADVLYPWPARACPHGRDQRQGEAQNRLIGARKPTRPRTSSGAPIRQELGARGFLITLSDCSWSAASAQYPPYLHPLVTASVFWVITLEVQEFDKGEDP